MSHDERFYQGDPDDIRFQFDIIKGLADSIRQLTGSINEMQKTQVGMLERLATLEANKFAETIQVIDARVDVLMRDKDRRDGAYGMLGTIKAWAPFLTVLLTAAVAFVVFGRMVGVVPPQPALAETRREEDRR